MADPLSLVRACMMKGVSITLENGFYSLMGLKFPEKTETSFKRSIGQGNLYYTLRDIMFYLENTDATNQDYRRRAIQLKLTAIIEQDKQDLKNYVNGVIQTCAQIDEEKARASSSALAKEASKAPSTATAPAPSQSETAPATATKGAKPSSSHEVSTEAAADDSKVPPAEENNKSDQPSSKPTRPEETHEERAARKKRKLVGQVAEAGELDASVFTNDLALLKKLRSDEIPSQDYKSVLYGKGRKNDDFHYVLKLFNDHVLRPKPKEMLSSSSKPNAADVSIVTIDGDRMRIKPIIIVPTALTSVINSFNCLQFFEGEYVSYEERRNAGAQRLPEQKFSRLLPNGKRIEYRIIDSPSQILKAEDWNHVVAAFVTGQMWQFKGWNDNKWVQPSEIFHQVMGVHLMMDDRPIDPAVASWNIKILKIHQSKRHLDAGAVNEFWAAVDHFVRLRKPMLGK